MLISNKLKNFSSKSTKKDDGQISYDWSDVPWERPEVCMCPAHTLISSLTPHTVPPPPCPFLAPRDLRSGTSTPTKTNRLVIGGGGEVH
jgi:hypothetical protein